jgi:RNA polymerase sigma-70 factor (ECF subfamily)
MNTTPASLLQRLRQPSCPDAWSHFVQLYTPLLYHWAHRSGFPRHEADDLVQDVFTTLVRKLPLFDYDPHKTFRGWLRTVALNKWNERRRQQVPAAEPLDGAATVDSDAPDPAAQFWEQEYRGVLLRRALQLMQKDFPDSWEACYQVLALGRPIAEVAAERSMTAGALRQAKFRLVARLRQELAGLLE